MNNKYPNWRQVEYNADGSARYMPAGVRLVTTNLVAMETHALLLHRADRRVALRFARSVAEPPTVLVTSTPELEQAAISKWLVPFADQDFSLADGVSFAVMAERRIARALALDAHFVTAGFDVTPPARLSRARR